MVGLARFSCRFSQRWQGIRQGIRSRALTSSCMPELMEKVSFFRVENNFALRMNMIVSHSEVECVSFCLCSWKVMKENCLLWYRVNLRVFQTMLNHNQNLFLIVCYCSVCLQLASLQKFFSSSFAYCAARALLVFSIVNKFWQRFLSLSFVLRCCNNFL